MREINQRVGAILKANDKEVHLLGYGVYEGDHVPENGWLHEAGIPNPRIKLDNGGYVYGYQCWWGGEDQVKKSIGDREVIPAKISTEDPSTTKQKEV